MRGPANIFVNFKRKSGNLHLCLWEGWDCFYDGLTKLLSLILVYPIAVTQVLPLFDLL